MRSRLRSLFKSLFSATRRENDMDVELRWHIDAFAQQLMDSGVPPDEAARRARAEFGNVTLLKEECREALGLRWFYALQRDLQYALRVLRKNRAFTLLAIASLAVGISANTAVFSIVNAILFRPIPVEKPEELVYLNTGQGINWATMSYPDYRDYRDRNTVLSGVTAYRFAPMSLSVEGGNQRLYGALVSGNYFQVLGVSAEVGRTLSPDDDRTPRSHPVAVISYASWLERFGGDPAIVGRTLKINGLTYTILGVTPREFMGTEIVFSPEIYVPMMMQPQIEPANNWLEERRTRNCFVLGRLKPGMTQAQAEQSLNAIAGNLGPAKRIVLSPPGLLGNSLRTPTLAFVAALVVLAGLVMIIACANIVSLLLARATDRQKEIVLRLSLGAGRAQIIRQLLVEAIVIAGAGGFVGTVLAYWVVSAISKYRAPVDFPFRVGVVMDVRVLAFAAVLSGVVSVVFGLVPALHATRTDFGAGLKNAAIFRLKRLELRDLLVTAQVAFSVVLLSGAVLALHSLNQAMRMTNVGFNPTNAYTATFDVALQGYDKPRGRQFQDAILAKVVSNPDVESAGLINSLPLGSDFSSVSIYVEGQAFPAEEDAPIVPQYQASSGYFHTMGTRLVAGRDFSTSDRDDAPNVIVVNEAFAKQIVHQDNAIGRRILSGPGDRNPATIIGIVEDGKYWSLAEDHRPAIFYPIDQRYNPSTTVVIRTRLPEAQAIQVLRTSINQADPDIPLFQVGSVADQLGFALAPPFIAAMATTTFGALAILLAGTGVYGVMGYAVARRTREIGIRMAIGATSNSILGLVVGRGVAILTLGLLIGATGAIALARVMAAVLYGISASNPLGIVVAAPLMTLVVLFASWSPARRAIRINPVIALREE